MTLQYGLHAELPRALQETEIDDADTRVREAYDECGRTISSAGTASITMTVHAPKIVPRPARLARSKLNHRSGTKARVIGTKITTATITPSNKESAR